MLKLLKTRNFRKLTDFSFRFTPGLQVVRGANEAGKSTMLEAIAYALFGVKACRDSLDQVVTWGQKDTTLKVELVFEYAGVEYTASRAKSGAEINYPGGKVTGQTETKEFIERLLGVDGAAVGRLMMANQGAIRGALDAGGKATMELIEQLADFDIIDQVIEAITGGLQTGHTSSYEEKVQTAVQKAEALTEAVQAPDATLYVIQVKEHQDAIAKMQTELDTTWDEQHNQAIAAVTEAESALQVRKVLRKSLEEARQSLKTREIDVQQALEQADTPVDVDRIGLLEDQIKGAG